MHQHAHDGNCRADDNRARLTWTLLITVGYLVAEIVGGYLADSLALLADAGHMFSDAAALGLSLFAAWISRRPATLRHSYGFYRAEILAALANGASLIVITILIFIEAARRFGQPEPVAGALMIGIAAGGLVANLVGMAILHPAKGENINLRGAWLHLATDALGSIAALVAGGLIWWFGWYWADPVASIAIGLLVLYSAWGLVQQAINILMEGSPAHIDSELVHRALAASPGVSDVHDLHIWTITSGIVSLSAHVVMDAATDSRTSLESLRQLLHEQFAIDHITIQIEDAGQTTCTSAGCTPAPR